MNDTVEKAIEAFSQARGEHDRALEIESSARRSHESAQRRCGESAGKLGKAHVALLDAIGPAPEVDR